MLHLSKVHLPQETMKFKVVFGFLCTLVKAKDIFEITLGPQKISEKDVQDVLENDGALVVKLFNKLWSFKFLPL